MTEDCYSASAGELAASESRQSSREIAARLSECYWDRIRHFAARRLRDRSLAEDVAQETMRVVLEALERGRIENLEAVGSFVFQTAKNLCMHHWRSEQRRSVALPKLGGAEADPAADALTSLVARERAGLLREVIGSLDSEERQLLALFYEEGLGAEEVGGRLAILAVTARVRKHRLLARIGAEMKERNTLPPAGTEQW